MSLTKWKQTFKRDGCAFVDGEVSVYLSGTTAAARVFDVNEKLIDSAPQLNTDNNGTVTFSIDTDDYPSGQLFDIFCASGGCITQNPIELKNLMILQDTEGGRAFKQIFAQAAEPDIDDNNVKDGDLWFDTDDGNHPYVCGNDAWVDIQDASIATVASDLSSLEDQVDDKVSIYVQEATPSWADDDLNHIDDCWYIPSEKKWYKYSGVAWVESDDSIYNINVLADGKTTIHYSATAPAAGLGVDGDYCVYENGGNNTYYKKAAGAWVKIGAYDDGADVTNDNTANNTDYVNGSETQTGNQYGVLGDLKIFNSGDLIFYDSSVSSAMSISNTTNYMYFNSLKDLYIQVQNETDQISLIAATGTTVVLDTDYIEFTTDHAQCIRFEDDYITIYTPDLIPSVHAAVSIGIDAKRFNIFASNLDISGTVTVDGNTGWNGTFTNGDGDTVTVTDGIITGVA